MKTREGQGTQQRSTESRAEGRGEESRGKRRREERSQTRTALLLPASLGCFCLSAWPSSPPAAKASQALYPLPPKPPACYSTHTQTHIPPVPSPSLPPSLSPRQTPARSNVEHGPQHVTSSLLFNRTVASPCNSLSMPYTLSAIASTCHCLHAIVSTHHSLCPP